MAVFHRYIGREIGLACKVNGKMRRVVGILVGFRNSKLLIKTANLSEPVGFVIGRDQWIPFYLGPKLDRIA